MRLLNEKYLITLGGGYVTCACQSEQPYCAPLVMLGDAWVSDKQGIKYVTKLLCQSCKELFIYLKYTSSLNKYWQ